MAPFDPYYIWLEIPPDEQPPTPHRLLGIAPDETDKEIIREAALQRNAFIRQFSLGEQGQIAEQLLNEIAAARDNVLAGKVQTAVETPSPTETPIEPVVEKVDPFAATPVSPILVADSGPVTQEFPVSTVQPTKKLHRKVQKEIWKQPAVMGVSLVVVIAVLVLLMFFDAADPVASNTAGRISAEMAVEKAAADKAAILAGDPITNTLHMTFNNIPAGTFLMGSPGDETGRSASEHQHFVTISRAFYMQTTEITQGQWKEMMGTEPWKGKNDGKEGANYAATYVSWDDAVAFCKKLSEKEGKTYRLPTEAEWEYGCRAGTTTTWSFGNDESALGDYAWYDENASEIDEKYAHQVGLKKPNALGLYDMYGNVYELCLDYYDENYYKESPVTDPMGPASGGPRVLRGGSWQIPTLAIRSARRDSDKAGSRLYSHVGFRLVRELDDSTQSAPPTPPVPVDPPVINLPRITNTLGMTLKKIPAGTFMMGSPEGEEDRYKDEHQHQITISKPFYMQTTEVTQGQWKEVMGTEPWKGEDYVKEGANYPASYVSWNDAVAYCKKLSEKEGKTYRLPTEAEWEYACRAGTQTRWSFGNDEKVLGDYAWYYENAYDIDEKYAHQVGLKKPNAFGLYDMHGNVFEWCHDYSGNNYYKQSPEKDPTGPTSGSFRVFRGGSWNFLKRNSRSAYRNWSGADHFLLLGFRLVRELD